jgi:hypothetical protein
MTDSKNYPTGEAPHPKPPKPKLKPNPREQPKLVRPTVAEKLAQRGKRREAAP